MYCPKCGAQNDKDAAFCKKCAFGLAKHAAIVDESEQASLAPNEHEKTSPHEQDARPDETQPARQASSSSKQHESSLKKELSSRQIVVISGIALFLFVAGIGGYAVINSIITNSPAAKQEAEKQAIKNETKSFVSEYGNRYSDTTSVYFAEKAYVEKNKSLIMTDGIINKYEIDPYIHGLISPLGFESYVLPLGIDLNQTTSMEIFNQYTSEMLTIYMNALARNPSEKGVAIVDSQFENYCSDNGLPGEAFTEDDENIQKLMNTCKAVVSKYGSAANYAVTKASLDTSGLNKDNTTFHDSPTASGSFDHNGETIETFSDSVVVVVDVELFNGEKLSKHKEIIEDVQLSNMRQPKSGGQIGCTALSIGQS